MLYKKGMPPPCVCACKVTHTCPPKHTCHGVCEGAAPHEEVQTGAQHSLAHMNALMLINARRKETTPENKLSTATEDNSINAHV